MQFTSVSNCFIYALKYVSYSRFGKCKSTTFSQKRHKSLVFNLRVTFSQMIVVFQIIKTRKLNQGPFKCLFWAFQGCTTSIFKDVIFRHEDPKSL